MTSLRVLVVGKDCPITERLEDVGHQVTPVDECDVAVEALQLQNFDAVVLAYNIPSRDLEMLAKEIHALNRRSTVHTAMLGIESGTLPGRSPVQLASPVQFDGYLPVESSPEAFNAAFLNLAIRSTVFEVSRPSQTELSILNADELQEHLDNDNELLLELISLYNSERKRQSPEMHQALASGDLPNLSRIVHTIKGSLGSLQAPSARAEAQLLELAALSNNREACERLLPNFELKLNQLEVELQALSRSLDHTH